MKKFILGFLTCLLLSTTVVYGASIIKSSYFNETLKLAINGSQADVAFVTVEVEGEQYGRNYVSVADFVKALNDKAGLNATVDFDSNTKTILVDSKVESLRAAPGATVEVKVNEILNSVSTINPLELKPTEPLDEGMEYVWYEYKGESDWCIQFNNSVYMNSFYAERALGYKEETRITGTFRENTYKNERYLCLGSKEVLWDRKNPSQVLSVPSLGLYYNLTWLIENFEQ